MTESLDILVGCLGAGGMYIYGRICMFTLFEKQIFMEKLVITVKQHVFYDIVLDMRPMAF